VNRRYVTRADYKELLHDEDFVRAENGEVDFIGYYASKGKWSNGTLKVEPEEAVYLVS
jgi:hypothetical protein|tara:strand:+ start:2434 stop:2607 length:174 start_codon:yes stop_codon:yes gene_type:complete